MSSEPSPDKFGIQFSAFCIFRRLLGRLGNSIHRSHPNPHLLSNSHFRQTISQELQHISTLFPGSRLTAFKLTLRIRDPDSLRLALQHHLPLKLGNGRQHRLHQLAGWRTGIKVDIQNLEDYLLLFQQVGNLVWVHINLTGDYI